MPTVIDSKRIGRVHILGRGKLGTSLDDAARAAGIETAAASARDEHALAEAVEHADLILLAVPDAAIGTVARRLADLDARPPATAHLGGALSLDELAPLAKRGAAVGSFHPFQPFSSSRPPSAFRGATVGIEASSPALLDRLAALAAAIGARARRVPDGQRELYHAAAVMASSYVVALAAEASALLQRLGWDGDESLAALLPLMEGTIGNLRDSGVPDALSGPLRRGDSGTVARHLDALDDLGRASALEAYRVLGLSALELAVQLGVPDSDAATVRTLLEGSDTSL